MSPADILEFLPSVHYLGVDISEKYVEAAKLRFGDRGHFICKPVEELVLDKPAFYDLVLAIGVFHHLDDSTALEALSLAQRALKPAGRLFSIDPCFVDGQSRIVRFLLKQDRGNFVRTEAAYLALARKAFPAVSSTIHHDLLRIPYTHLILNASHSSLVLDGVSCAVDQPEDVGH